MGMINFSQHMTPSKKRLDERNNTGFNNRPVLFIEQPSQVIWPRGFL